MNNLHVYVGKARKDGEFIEAHDYPNFVGNSNEVKHWINQHIGFFNDWNLDFIICYANGRLLSIVFTDDGFIK